MHRPGLCLAVTREHVDHIHVDLDLACCDSGQHGAFPCPRSLRKGRGFVLTLAVSEVRALLMHNVL